VSRVHNFTNMTVLGGMSSVKLKNLKGSMFRPKLGNRPGVLRSYLAVPMLLLPY
jgi:hypothetical protein